jgi:hypothetical protein
MFNRISTKPNVAKKNPSEYPCIHNTLPKVKNKVEKAEKIGQGLGSTK